MDISENFVQAFKSRTHFQTGMGSESPAPMAEDLNVTAVDASVDGLVIKDFAFDFCYFFIACNHGTCTAHD